MPVSAKICGLNTAAAVAAAHHGGAAFYGFIFHPASPRAVTAAEAAALAAPLPPEAGRVAVLVDAGDAEIAAILGLFPASHLQLHGAESPARTAEIRQRFGLPVIRAVGVASAGDVAQAGDNESAADYLLFDTRLAASGETGGTGKAFDWGLLSGYEGRKPWFVSGGLEAANVGAAVAATGARLVDASSRLESSPGVKDAVRIGAFLHTVSQLP